MRALDPRDFSFEEIITTLVTYAMGPRNPVSFSMNLWTTCERPLRIT